MLPPSTMALPSSILATILLFSLPKPTFAQKDNGDECSCFRTNGSSEGYFAYHRFHDFRNVAGASATAPTVLANMTNATNALATSDFFLSDDWTNDWTIQNWNNTDNFAESGAAILMINSPNNVYIEQSTDNSSDYSSYLTFRTSRLPGFQSAAQIDSNEQNFQYLSARFNARVIGSPGACAGMFTYLDPDNDPNKVQEADIEILTRDPRNRVQYTNQPSTVDGNDVPQATVNGTNPTTEWTQWNVYRMDWMPKTTSWYVNGGSVANISFQVPRDPTTLIVNMWSDGGVWTQNMSLYDEAYLQIQWMEFVYNTSGPYTGSKNRKRDWLGAGGVLEKRKGTPGCKVVCSVDDEVNVTGTPALLYNSTAATILPWSGEGVAALIWIPLVLVGGAVFGYL